jgi:mannose-6-phosphate isomerase
VEPIIFQPIYQERVWGGRTLEQVYGRVLPGSSRPYGEAWELVDREHEQSIVQSGPLAGTTLHQLWNTRRSEIFGPAYQDQPHRFPILIKILDARDDLSLQVHPPAEIARSLGGEPKTEMWYVADRNPGAKLYLGLKRGVTRDQFERAVANGDVARLVHVVSPEVGDSIFLPSGRLHAIGAGFLIHEIQQNSDTTYRVFDWNRSGLDGCPRELHVEQSLASIDFDDFEPPLDRQSAGVLAECAHFRTELLVVPPGGRVENAASERFSILSVVSGTLAGASDTTFRSGATLLLPAHAAPLTALAAAKVLRITLPA